FYYIFFFQAEDGIRGFHVTGVQTCALPICQQTLNPVVIQFIKDIVQQQYRPVSLVCPQYFVLGKFERNHKRLLLSLRSKTFHLRSEERRVGKESRIRWISKQ